MHEVAFSRAQFMELAQTDGGDKVKNHGSKGDISHARPLLIRSAKIAGLMAAAYEQFKNIMTRPLFRSERRVLTQYFI